MGLQFKYENIEKQQGLIEPETASTASNQIILDTTGFKASPSFSDATFADKLDDALEGYTKEQFMTALEVASGRIAEKAEASKKVGFIGTDASKKLLDAILDADS